MTNSNQQIALSAKNYSQALIELEKDSQLTFDEINNDLNIISEILNMSAELKHVLENPSVAAEVKNEIVNDVFQKDIHPQIINFLKILIDKKRFNELNQIKADFENKLDKINNIQTVEIVSAVELKEDYRNEIIQKLGEKLHKNIRPIWLIDENIIAGLIYKINDDVIDSSIKNKLDKLNKELM